MVNFSQKRVAILGFHEGNAGQVAEWFESVTGHHLDCYVVAQDEPLIMDIEAENRKRVSQRMAYPQEGLFKGKPLITSLDWINVLKARGIQHLLPLVSNNAIRHEMILQAKEAGFELVSAIHPTATILDQAQIEPGVWINARAIIGYKAEIKAGAMINTGVIIEHHNILESCCQIDPGAVFGGHVTLRERCHVHMGAILFNRIVIGEDAEVGAGSLVRYSIPARTCHVGAPARFHRHV